MVKFISYRSLYNTAAAFIVCCNIFKRYFEFSQLGHIFLFNFIWYGYYFFSREAFRQFVYKSGKLTGSMTMISTVCYIFWITVNGFPAFILKKTMEKGYTKG
jgi:hypothetical protein